MWSGIGWIKFLSSSLLGLQAQTPAKKRKKSIKHLAAVIWSMSGPASRVYSVTGNDNVGKALEKEVSGPEVICLPHWGDFGETSSQGA